MNTMDARAMIDAETERLRSLGEMAENEYDDGQDGHEDEHGQGLLDLGGELNLKVGGTKPTHSEVKIKSISLPVRGQLDDESDDEMITVLVTARVDELRMVKNRASDGQLTKKIRRHVLTPVSVLTVDPEEADRLLGLD